MDLKQDMKELYRILDDQKLLASELKHHKAYICQQHHPLKIGDEVVVNDWSHKGKEIVVDRVWLHDDFFNKYDFRASGKVKKKDGSLGKQIGEWHNKNESL